MEIQDKVEKYAHIYKVSCLNWNLHSTNIFLFSIKYIEYRVKAIDYNGDEIRTDTQYRVAVKLLPPMRQK
jgi:hypothetical protein